MTVDVRLQEISFQKFAFSLLYTNVFPCLKTALLNVHMYNTHSKYGLKGQKPEFSSLKALKYLTQFIRMTSHGKKIDQGSQN